MKRTLVLISVLACVSMTFTGCGSEIETNIPAVSVNQNTDAVTEAAENKDTSVTEITEPGVSNEAPSKDSSSEDNAETPSNDNAESPSNDQGITESAAQSQISEKYAFSDDIICPNAEAVKNSDGSIRITFENGKFAVTLPEELENHFVITKGGQLTSKVLYNKRGSYSKMAGFSCIDGINKGFGIPLGRIGNEIMHSFHATDSDRKPYDPDYPEVNEELDLIESNLSKIYSTSESYNEKTGKMERYFEVSRTDGSIIYGNIDIRDKSEQLCGILTDDFIYGNVSKEDSKKYPVEDGWHIYVTRAVTLEDGTYYDCYDNDDNDHYGWIHSMNLYFENGWDK